MADRVYITMTGVSKWPVLNSLWAAICCKGYLPDRIYMFVTKGRETDSKLLARWMSQAELEALCAIFLTTA